MTFSSGARFILIRHVHDAYVIGQWRKGPYPLRQFPVRPPPPVPAPMTIINSCLGGAVVRRRTRDRKVAGSTPGRGPIKSSRSTRPSIPPG